MAMAKLLTNAADFTVYSSLSYLYF